MKLDGNLNFRDYKRKLVQKLSFGSDEDGNDNAHRPVRGDDHHRNDNQDDGSNDGNGSTATNTNAINVSPPFMTMT